MTACAVIPDDALQGLVEGLPLNPGLLEAVLMVAVVCAREGCHCITTDTEDAQVATVLQGALQASQRGAPLTLRPHGCCPRVP